MLSTEILKLRNKINNCGTASRVDTWKANIEIIHVDKEKHDKKQRH